MKKHILTFALTMLATLSHANPYSWPVVKVIDGDTVQLKVTLLPELGDHLSLRIYGIDTPEKGFRAKCDKEAALGKRATEYTTNAVARANKREIIVREWDKYGGRILGDLVLDGKQLRDMIIAAGLAREYYGEKKSDWCK